MIKAVLIDIDNTLLDFNKCAFVAMRNAAKDVGITLPENVDEVFCKINTQLWKDIEKGTLTKEKLHKIRWCLIFDELGIDFDGEEFEKLFLKEIFYGSQSVDGAKEILEYLSEKYILCAASNGAVKQQKNRLSCAGFSKYFNHIFLSEEAGYEKPDERFFDYCKNALGDIGKDEMIIIGDSYTADILGGINYGIKTLWFKYDKNLDIKDDRIDYTVEELEEIKNIL